MAMTMEREATGLPEGVYMENGKYFRKVRRMVRDADGGLAYELIPRECALVNPFETDEAVIHEARERAARRGLDFYDPRTVNGQVVGWLAHGRKRSDEWPENVGTAGSRYEREPVPESENPDIAAGITVPAGDTRKGNQHGK